MLLLVVAALLVFGVSAWLLARPIRQSSTAALETSAQYRQYALARDRVLRQLELVEAQAGDGVLDSGVASDETLRLEAELAAILKHLDELGETGEEKHDAGETRLKWYLALVVFGLVVPLVALLMYGSWQFDSLLKLAGAGTEPVITRQSSEVPPAQQFPPEVIAMVERLEQKLANNPDDGEGWKRLGRSYAVMGRSSEARGAYQRAAELLPDDRDIQSALAGLLAGTAAPATGDQPQFPPQVLQMVAQLEGKLRDNPEDGEGWKRLGRAYTVMQRYSEAVSAYSSAAELLPNDKSIEQALQQLAQVAARNKKHAGTSADDNQQAAHPPLPEGSLEQIVRLEKRVGEAPSNPVSWAELGRAYLRIGQGEDAIRALQKAHELAEDNITILAMYAEAVFQSDPRDPQGRALTLYKKLNELSPRHPDGLWFLGLAAYSEGNLGRTVELWSQLLQVLPPGSEGHASVQQALAKVELLLNKEK